MGGREGYGKMLNLKSIFIYKNRLVSQKSSLLKNFEMKTIFYLLNYKRGNAPLPPLWGKGGGYEKLLNLKPIFIYKYRLGIIPKIKSVDQF